MRNGNERKPSSSSSSSSSSLRLDCEVELGLKMQVQVQSTHSYSCDGEPFFSSPCVDTIYHLPPTFSSEGCGKSLFTEKQWEELERQRKIHRYVVASIPVPPQLLLPTSTSLSQSAGGGGAGAGAGVELRFPRSGSDPEPWRCKRTDGKKWRCSRDVAGDHKYCERHAHKTKSRSRKLVELSSHKPYFLPPSSNPITTSFEHTRCMEWLMRGKSSDNNSARKQEQQRREEEEWEELMHLSSSNKKMAVYDLEEKESSYMSMNPPPPPPYIPDRSRGGFIDGWDEKEGNVYLSSNFTSSSSLTLSNSNSNSKESDGLMRGAEWMNTVSWIAGGPLGEALCLGNASVTRGYGNI